MGRLGTGSFVLLQWQTDWQSNLAAALSYLALDVAALLAAWQTAVFCMRMLAKLDEV